MAGLQFLTENDSRSRLTVRVLVDKGVLYSENSVTVFGGGRP